MKRYYLTYVSENETNQGQIEECLQAYKDFTKDFIDPLTLRCSFFIQATNNSEYLKKKHLIRSNSEHIFYYPSIIGQAPIHGKMALECVVIDKHEHDFNFYIKTFRDHPYILLEHNGNKKIYAAGLSASLNASIKDQSMEAFHLAEGILANENMDFSDVIRQWNYIENITKTVLYDDQTFQHYQLFNDVRSLYYQKVHFKNGYPAATGIGMNTGGIILDIIAGKGDDFGIIPIDNPEQISAHNYSENVLIGKEIEEFEKKSTPKFERAKYIDSVFGKTLYISGTAAIKGELTIPSDDILRQTEVTIDNIKKLKYAHSDDHDYSMFRLYVKDHKQAEKSFDLATAFFQETSGLVLTGPVCRDNLIVEIEAEKEII